jgi:hypothetical protein
MHTSAFSSVPHLLRAVLIALPSLFTARFGFTQRAEVVAAALLSQNWLAPQVTVVDAA